jgi:hypothetical protein
MMSSSSKTLVSGNFGADFVGDVGTSTRKQQPLRTSVAFARSCFRQPNNFTPHRHCALYTEYIPRRVPRIGTTLPALYPS